MRASHVQTQKLSTCVNQQSDSYFSFFQRIRALEKITPLFISHVLYVPLTMFVLSTFIMQTIPTNMYAFIKLDSNIFYRPIGVRCLIQFLLSK